jgi:hypothetical protein
MFIQPQQQKRIVSAPLVQDKTLREYSGSIQDNLFDLWEISHTHPITSSDKASYAALTTDTDRIAFIAQFIGLR